MLTILVIVVLTALAFDYINGFHDTANAVATVISTGVLPARTAILMAAILNFVGALVSTSVADFISKSMVDLRGDTALQLFASLDVNPASGALVVVLAGLIGASVWNLVTWYFGIPSSSSHALLGGIVGSAWFSLGAEVVKTSGIQKALLMLFLSPLIGFIAAFFVMVIVTWVVRGVRPTPAKRAFRWLQLMSASLMAFSHGSNDAQKSMGVIALALMVSGYIAPGDKVTVPVWVALACATAMMLGTASGGHRIIRTMGHKIIALQPVHGFAAETTAAAVIQTSTAFGMPLSTTHVISSCIMGVGASKRFSAVRWGVAGNIVIAWVLTIPVCALLAGMLAKLMLALLA